MSAGGGLISHPNSVRDGDVSKHTADGGNPGNTAIASDSGSLGSGFGKTGEGKKDGGKAGKLMVNGADNKQGDIFGRMACGKCKRHQAYDQGVQAGTLLDMWQG